MNQADWREFYGVGGSEKLPLVSIIAINFSYAAYLKTALESAAAQDYPALEIIVLDNGSEDNSVPLIEAFVERHPEVRFIKLAKNLGQLGAAHHILTQHSVGGDYIAFLDTDDFLFPSFISHHIRAHLLVANGAGISTSETLQLDREGTIVAGNIPLWWKSQAIDPSDWKTVEVSTDHKPPQILDFTLVAPRITQWLWFPGTSNVYNRKSIDELFSAIVEPIEKRFTLDTCAAPVGHLGQGSIMLHEILSCYRVHDRNSSVTAPTLQHFSSGRASFSKGNKQQHRWFRKSFKHIKIRRLIADK
ncbi:glycosyltransferase family 2 protein [Kaistia terrae]|uniref:Glycosyltransferase family 2 protein n=1 Tax=Kaistia terrae TaxID=537017 RepID=A0ABW0PR37_9HYPH|nr:glycosyltransferase family A protein [Kaistia terrae]MCX5578344.1 glycosyltransferase family A protein [Kaistia terrae]